MWPSKANMIQYTTNRTTEKVSQLCQTYCDQMRGTRGEKVVESHKFWLTFAAKIKANFMTQEEVRDTQQKMRQLKYTDIENYLREIRQLNLKIRWRSQD